MENSRLKDTIMELRANIRRAINDGLFIAREADVAEMISGTRMGQDDIRGIIRILFEIEDDKSEDQDWEDVAQIRDILDAAQVSFDATWRSVVGTAILAPVDKWTAGPPIDDETLDKLLAGGPDAYLEATK